MLHRFRGLCSVSRPLLQCVTSTVSHSFQWKGVKAAVGSGCTKRWLSVVPSPATATWCGDVTSAHVGKVIHVRGWLQAIRDFGGVTFLLLRDSHGVLQLTLDKAVYPDWASLRMESVVEAKGLVQRRPDGQSNPSQITGDYEVNVSSLTVLNQCGPLPFQLHTLPSEEVRLTHRHIDLRRTSLQHNLRLRSDVALGVRSYLQSEDFVDVETPTLFRSTPEGAREFIVPTRTPGKFYALVQSPQQYKQLLMVGGMERYYQFARCYRDEDGRADRQPEFTQIDIEMSFVKGGDVMRIAEGVFLSAVAAAKASIAKLAARGMSGDPSQTPLPTLTSPFPTLPYRVAMRRYGSDKPDRRFGMPVTSLNQCFSPSQFSGFAPFDALIVDSSMGVDAGVYGIAIPQLGSTMSRKDLTTFSDAIAAKVGDAAAKTVAVCKIEADGSWKSPLANKLAPAVQAHINTALGVKGGDVIVLCGGRAITPCVTLGGIRFVARDACDSKGIVLSPEPELAEQWGVPPRTSWRKLNDVYWVVDFPMFEPSESGSGGYQPCHHPFTAPIPAHEPLLRQALARLQAGESGDVVNELLFGITAQHYDLVYNGVEVAGGSIRIHDSALQRDVMSTVLRLPSAVVDSFGHLLRALSDGAPPHGGIAFGYDRLIAMLANANSLRDVIAFPKSAIGHELMTGSPAGVPEDVLAQYRIKTV